MTTSPTDPPTDPPPTDAPESHRPPRPFHNIVLPAAVLLLIAASILHYVHADGFLSFPASSRSSSILVAGFALYFLTRPALAIFAGVLLLQHRRLVPLAIATLVWAAVMTLFSLLFLLSEDLNTYTRASYLLDIYRTADFTCLTLTLLCFIHLPLLRGRAVMVQRAASASVVAFLLLQTAARFLPPRGSGGVGTLLDELNLILFPVVGVLLVVALPLTAYLSLRRRIPFAHDPPIDAGPSVSLTCPRCHSAQQIPTNGGQCRDCRLQIYIALAEGRCKTCGYALRSLTGDQCPECGTRFAPADPDKELLAWAAANDRSVPPSAGQNTTP